jgi:hypothetical protein
MRPAPGPAVIIHEEYSDTGAITVPLALTC